MNLESNADALPQDQPTLYARLLAAGCAMDHHESDLYVELSEAAAEVFAQIERESGCRVRAEKFINQVTKTAWLELPFMHEPFWNEVSERAGRNK